MLFHPSGCMWITWVSAVDQTKHALWQKNRYLLVFMFAYLDDYVWCHHASSDSFYQSFFVEIRRFCKWPYGSIHSVIQWECYDHFRRSMHVASYSIKCICFSVIFLRHLCVLFCVFVCIIVHSPYAGKRHVPTPLCYNIGKRKEEMQCSLCSQVFKMYVSS